MSGAMEFRATHLFAENGFNKTRIKDGMPCCLTGNIKQPDGIDQHFVTIEIINELGETAFVYEDELIDTSLLIKESGI